MTLSAFVVVADDRKLRPEEAGFKKIRPGFKDDEERAMEAMIDEWEEALIKKHATQEDMENITYVLHKEAGDSNKTFYYWHVFVFEIGDGQFYGWRADGNRNELFDSSKVLLDPYADAVYLGKNYSRDDAKVFGT